MAKSKRRITCPQYAELITWIDHNEPYDDTAADKRKWRRPSNLDDVRATVIFSAGFVAKENARMLELVRDMAEDGLVGARLHIMKRAILRRRRIRVASIPLDALK